MVQRIGGLASPAGDSAVTVSPGQQPEALDEESAPQAAEVVAPSADHDDNVLVLREQGRSFAGIARTLGLDSSTQANAAFNRALRRLPAGEQESVRVHEMARLDALGERVRQRGDLDEAELARRMRSLDRLRKTLLSA